MIEARPEIGSTISIDKADFNTFLTNLQNQGFETIGPRIQQDTLVNSHISNLEDLPFGIGSQQEPGHYHLIKSGKDNYFDFIPGAHSWKQYLFPSRVDLFHLELNNSDWMLTKPETIQPKFAFIGVRACELAAIQIQDGIFIRSDYSDPVYKSRRQNLFILAVNCMHPNDTCFCSSLNSGPRVERGFDLCLTELDNIFLLEIGSELGRTALTHVPFSDASAFLLQTAQKGLDLASKQTRQLDTSDLPELLLHNLDHPHWDEIAERCFSCGNCTQVCPTCFCWDTVDTQDLLGQSTRRERVWDSCFNPGFSYLAGGNTRPTIRSRYRQWLSHKLGTWIEQQGMLGCTGCGRCITWCPPGIDLTEEISVFRKESYA
ncbi:4Fe-4S dicluster domain-containing protein [Chloroflexota bacterium]